MLEPLHIHYEPLANATQARQSELTDAEIAMLIADKTGPSLISQVYGDLRPDHLVAQAKQIQLRAVHVTGRASVA